MLVLDGNLNQKVWLGNSELATVFWTRLVLLQAKHIELCTIYAVLKHFLEMLLLLLPSLAWFHLWAFKQSTDKLVNCNSLMDAPACQPLYFEHLSTTDIESSFVFYTCSKCVWAATSEQECGGNGYDAPGATRCTVYFPSRGETHSET